jgi:hypothetical protein
LHRIKGLYRYAKVFVEHDLGQPETIDKGDWIFPFFGGFIDCCLREVTGGDHGSPREWLQASTQFGNFLPAD